MCRPDSCVTPPVCITPFALPAARRFDLVWSRSIIGHATGWGESTGYLEHISAADWEAITAAAVVSSAAMLAALDASPAGPAWARAQAKCLAHGGQPALDQLVALMRQRYARWDGQPLDW
jgi:hypothetical protein